MPPDSRALTGSVRGITPVRASAISASTIPAARCGPAVEGLIPRRPHDKIGVAAAYVRVGDNARIFDSDIGSFGNFFYSVRRMETMVDGAHSHLSCFSLPCQRNAFSRSVIQSRRSMSSSIMSFSGRITSVVCRARPYRRSSNGRQRYGRFRVCDLHLYLDEMREALNKWEAFVQAICVDASITVAA